jgi:drug/metabolite transporter (DMT)-like permease
MTPASNTFGIIAMIAAMGMSVAAESISKLVFAHIPMFEVMFLRGLVGTVLCVLAAIVMGHGRALAAAFNPFVLARGGIEMTANLFYAFAIINMPIADVSAILQTAPLLVLLGAAYFYGEKLNLKRIALIFVGFMGALLVAQPGSSAASPFAILCFLIAALIASRDLLTRRVPETVPAPIVACTVMACLTLAAGVGMMVSRQPAIMPSASHGTMIVLAGALLAFGQLCIFLAYKTGEARAISPFMYTMTIWAVGFGYMLFGDIPDWVSVTGMGLILVAGVLVIYTDRRKAGAEAGVAPSAVS